MARPLATGKQSVNLAPKGPPGSRIRRDPPPKVKEVVVRDPEERDARDVAIGVLAFALALFVIILAFAAWSGWTPSAYVLEI